MQQQAVSPELVPIEDTWNLERTDEELRSFVSERLLANPLSEALLVQ